MKAIKYLSIFEAGVEVKVGWTYELKKSTKWGGLFQVHKISDKGVVCGRYKGSIWGSQGACIKIQDFIEMIK